MAATRMDREENLTVVEGSTRGLRTLHAPNVEGIRRPERLSDEATNTTSPEPSGWRNIGPLESVAQVANRLASIGEGIDAALRPIIGRRGVGALFRRSMFLTAPAHPWLADADDGAEQALEMPSLAAVFAQQTRAEAFAAGGLLLRTFHRLLAGLVGVALTEQLLRPVWEDAPDDPPAQEPPP
jgi:hypothetical protein